MTASGGWFDRRGDRRGRRRDLSGYDDGRRSESAQTCKIRRPRPQELAELEQFDEPAPSRQTERQDDPRHNERLVERQDSATKMRGKSGRQTAQRASLAQKARREAQRAAQENAQIDSAEMGDRVVTALAEGEDEAGAPAAAAGEAGSAGHQTRRRRRRRGGTHKAPARPRASQPPADRAATPSQSGHHRADRQGADGHQGRATDLLDLAARPPSGLHADQQPHRHLAPNRERAGT